MFIRIGCGFKQYWKAITDLMEEFKHHYTKRNLQLGRIAGSATSELGFDISSVDSFIRPSAIAEQPLIHEMPVVMAKSPNLSVLRRNMQTFSSRLLFANLDSVVSNA